MPKYPWEPHSCTEALDAEGWGSTLTAVAAAEPPKIAESLQAQFAHLAPGARIAWAYVAKELRDSGHVVAAKIALVSKAVSTQLQVIGGVPADEQPDFTAEVNMDEWLECTDAEQRAVVHHLLCHAEKRNGRWTLAPHDLHEFSDVVAEHGLYTSRIRAMAEALQPHLPGLEDNPASLDAQMGNVVSMTPEIRRAFNQLREGAGEGGSVTLTAGDRSVTLTGKAPSEPNDLPGVDFTQHAAEVA
jgi:hypothetical protein